jgi:glycerol-3-phosphate acyltransferase PlsX
MPLAIDAMGGDQAPAAIVHGTVQAAIQETSSELVLVGDRTVVEAELESAIAQCPPESRDGVRSRVRVFHASETVRMHEAPVEALRRKPDSSIARCVELVKKGEADGLVTAGNTGAAVAATTISLRLLDSVRKPGIAVTLPSRTRVCTVIDVGANIKCKPIHLFHYGVMATYFCKRLLDIEEPSIGLMNVGEEDEKGNELVRQTSELFRRSELNFIGNIEGQDLFSGKCDVIVCDGFVGNVVLKVSEGVAAMTAAWLQDTFEESPAEGREKEVWREALRVFKEHTDYATYGGALLLGVDGVCVICHGRSGSQAIVNAIRGALRFIESNINEHIEAGLRSHRGTINPTSTR